MVQKHILQTYTLSLISTDVCLAHYHNNNNRNNMKPDPGGDSLSIGVIVLIAVVGCVLTIGLCYAIYRYVLDACYNMPSGTTQPGYHEVRFPSFSDTAAPSSGKLPSYSVLMEEDVMGRNKKSKTASTDT